MATAIPISEYTALDILRAWKRLVNDKAMAGRDGKLIKDFLQQVSPIQMMLGLYQYQGEKGLSVPAFLSCSNEWLEQDENKALIALAICLTDTAPFEYWIWCDYRDEESAYAKEQSEKALGILLPWARRVVG